ncbi:hypothetical protein SAY87_029131 [Trapa incisa]|uniref:Survival protein SurE-like phosphatase/nucleotidase domain-containing protein n=1 Tax=Trapa incisa TaxID=236973 RepID=A0AAN7L454_9MYRT|nr:hypothetical protein SAY87_029131 [Trapa incisa]
MTSVKNMLPQALVSNLQEALLKRKSDEPSETAAGEAVHPSTSEPSGDSSKPVVLVTNGDGIESPGLAFLVEALVREGLYDVHVCAPQSDKSLWGHSVTHGERIAATSAEINGATAFEVSGTPVDCISLALSGALFSWLKPLLVVSGINRGSSCGYNTFYSGSIAGAMEALICGVPSLSISLNWKENESQESDFKDAVTVCLPLINAVIGDIGKESFPKNCAFKIEIPTSPSSNKGFKLTKQSTWRSIPSWSAVSANRHPSAGFMSNHQSLGLQLAQLSRDASAAGAARRLTTQKKNVEIDSIGAMGKPDTEKVKKYFRLEFSQKEVEDMEEEMDIMALESGFVSHTSLLITYKVYKCGALCVTLLLVLSNLHHTFEPC